MSLHFSERLNRARRAFGNAESSREVHGLPMECFNKEIREYSALRNRALVISGFGGLCAASWAMGTTSQVRDCTQWSLKYAIKAVAAGAVLAYAACRSMILERYVYDIEFKREMWEIENDLKGEIQEMIDIYKAQGLTHDEALIVTRIFSKRKKLFANLMMVEELGYSRLEPPLAREIFVDVAIPTVIGFSAGALLPSFISHSMMQLLVQRNEVTDFCVLVSSLTMVTMAQSEVHLGSYSSTREILKGILHNLCALGLVYGVARVIARIR